MKPLHLKGRKVADRVLRKGGTWKGKTMIVRWLPGGPRGEEKGVFLGTFASAKLDKSAVKRNRMRRRCREAIRLSLLKRDRLPALQLLVSPRSSSLTCAFEDIQADVETFFSSLRS